MIDPTARIIGNPDIHPTARIDAFCVITGYVEIGRNVHVSTGCRLIGSSGKITLMDYSNVSIGTTILTANDDYTEGYAIGACVPEEYRKVSSGHVTLMEFSAAGANSVILPGVTLHYGAVAGALSLVTRDIPACEIWAGIPASFIKSRNRNRLESISEEIKEEQ